MHGHRAEVSSVKWHNVISRWVTGSEDGTIRIWADTGEEEKVLNVKKPITCLTCDKERVDIQDGNLIFQMSQNLSFYNCQ